MARADSFGVPEGTSEELVSAAELGARMAVRRLRAQGLGDAAIRRQIVVQFRQEMGNEGFGDLESETLMSAVQRGVEQALRAG
jgi:hypothetical protein